MIVRLVALAVGSAVAVAIAPATALAETSGSWYYQQGKVGGGVASYAQFGRPDDRVIVGDWNGDRKDTLAVRRGATYYMTNSPSGGATSYQFNYGTSSDVTLVGDWDGNGTDTLAVRRGGRYYLTNGTRGGVASIVFNYGTSTDTVLVGDWNGDGRDTLAVRRGNRYYFTNSTKGGAAELVASFGRSDDVVFTGDWNADRKDTLGIRRGNQYHLTNRSGGGVTDVVESFGTADDSFLVGDWNGDRVDTLAVRRALPPKKTLAGSGSYVVPTQAPALLYKGSAPADGCYWERVSDFSGSFDSIIANGLHFGMSSLYVQLRSTDAGFVSDGCGTWVEARQDDPVTLRTVANGQYRVGHDMLPGRYAAPGGAECYWERVGDFTGEGDALLANDFGPSSPVVDVVAGDAGFSSQDCGTWTRIGDAVAAAAAADDVEVTSRFATADAR
jgi:hypothetical protein